jgi:beta-lactamase superfamily II metal-dependent hydrolase
MSVEQYPNLEKEDCRMYDGVEIDMLSVGDADCILVTKWAGSAPVRVLIDGGNKGDFSTVRNFLRRRGISFLDAIVCTHLHADHAAGLIELVQDRSITFGGAYMHVPQRHLSSSLVQKTIASLSDSKTADSIRKSLATATDLASAFTARGKVITEPFAGTKIEFLTVVGPSREYYEELLRQFGDVDAIKRVDTQETLHKFWAMLHDQAAESLDTDLPSDPQTTPENNSSVILAFIDPPMDHKYLFTSDAGVPALQKALESYVLANCHWMQIPHHGSRRNINPALIKTFSPTYAWASAEGNKKHPRRAIVNAFKEAGATVSSTHYPHPGDLWKYRGSVPPRDGYGPLVSLYDAVPSKMPPPPGLPGLGNSYR